MHGPDSWRGLIDAGAFARTAIVREPFAKRLALHAAPVLADV